MRQRSWPWVIQLKWLHSSRIWSWFLSLPFEVFHNHQFGLSIRTKTSSVQSLGSALWGLQQPVNNLMLWNELKRRGFSSLLDSNGWCCIMYGPLSLINHHCNSDWKFRKDSIALDVQSIPVPFYEGSNIEKGFRLIDCQKERMLHRQKDNDRSKLTVGTEIFCFYGNKLNFPCSCSHHHVLSLPVNSR